MYGARPTLGRALGYRQGMVVTALLTATLNIIGPPQPPSLPPSGAVKLPISASHVGLKYSYVWTEGFIGAGGDVEPPAELTVTEALARCDSSPSCRGITYAGANSTRTPVNVRAPPFSHRVTLAHVLPTLWCGAAVEHFCTRTPSAPIITTLGLGPSYPVPAARCAAGVLQDCFWRAEGFWLERVDQGGQCDPSGTHRRRGRHVALAAASAPGLLHRAEPDARR